ncbi:hypothetical protein HK405_004566 [Cladochytrium tenue]|nr:hypothetical protein HK405_004566 [Cladochytrium tenue]
MCWHQRAAYRLPHPHYDRHHRPVLDYNCHFNRHCFCLVDIVVGCCDHVVIDHLSDNDFNIIHLHLHLCCRHLCRCHHNLYFHLQNFHRSYDSDRDLDHFIKDFHKCCSCDNDYVGFQGVYFSATATTSVPVRYKCSAGSVAVRVSSSTTTSAAAATTTTSAAKASSTTTSTAAAGTTTAATAATTSKTTTTAAAASTASNVVPSYNPSADQLLQSLLTAIAGLANKPDIATVLAAAAALDPALNATQLLAQITAAGSRTVTQATFTALLTSLGVSDASITAAGGITGVLTSLIGDLSKTTVAAAVIAVQGTLTGLGATLTSIADVATKVLGALLSG